ncbi:hypothetical protein LSS_19810 [Leptospira santarosai serovar Shermani str. LT 821]|uniref:Uncharacterized protein n=1 Tax=Leptospira santarosai serovar Shermani str. LT 821 TaxID=758847 RepID=K8Y5G1_9LEPT|nr:hypothetical protein LSS_19810 [Leptospira santarosai serovar Shermani str. LT 821]
MGTPAFYYRPLTIVIFLLGFRTGFQRKWSASEIFMETIYSVSQNFKKIGPSITLLKL